VKYTFAPKVKGKVLIATVTELNDRSGVQIALLRRAATEDEPFADSDP
jgi:hypothetical protein